MSALCFAGRQVALLWERVPRSEKMAMAQIGGDARQVPLQAQRAHRVWDVSAYGAALPPADGVLRAAGMRDTLVGFDDATGSSG
jgi:hypothetical protein